LQVSKWSCLAAAGSAPQVGNPAGRVDTPASPVLPWRELGAVLGSIVCVSSDELR
jgi:hypothetical protein